MDNSLDYSCAFEYIVLNEIMKSINHWILTTFCLKLKSLSKFQAWALVGMHGFHTFAELLWAGLFVLGQNSDDGRTSCKLQRT